MICPKCSTELLLDYTFCPQCGARLPASDMQSDDSFNGSENEENLTYASPAVSGFTEAPAAPAAPAVPVVPADDIFASPTPLTQTMPSPYVSTDPSVFVAQPAPQETTVTANVANPYVAPAPAPVRDSKKPAGESAQTKAPIAEPAEPVIPKEYKALTTAGIFWYFFLVCIPVVGWICLLSFALGGKNKSKKSLSRAILIYWIIFILLVCLTFIVAFVFNRSFLIQLFDSQNWINLGDFLFQTFINR